MVDHPDFRDGQRTDVQAEVRLFIPRNGRLELFKEFEAPLNEFITVDLITDTVLKMRIQLPHAEGVRPVFQESHRLRLTLADHGRVVGVYSLRPLGEAVDARVVDAATGEPIRGVRFLPGNFRDGRRVLGVAGLPHVDAEDLLGVQTDVLGRVRLPNVEADGYHGDPWLFTDHPDYAPSPVSLAPRQETVEELPVEVRLHRNARLELRLLESTTRLPVGVELLRLGSEAGALDSHPRRIEGVRIEDRIWVFEAVSPEIWYWLEALGAWPEQASLSRGFRLKPGENRVLSWSAKQGWKAVRAGD